MSLYLTTEDQSELLAWAAPRMGASELPDCSLAVGVCDEQTGKIRAVLVTCQFYDGIVDCHFASDGSKTWATRNILGGLFGWIFFYAYKNTRRAQTVTAVNDDKTLIMNFKLGWKFEGTLEQVMDDGRDGVIMSMTPATCRWIKDETHG